MTAGRITFIGIILAAVVYFFIPSSYEIRNAPPPSGLIVCFGDSLTYGTGAGKGMDYPAQLSRLMGREIINAGVPGDTTADALKRLDQVVALHPGIVLITLGGNDLKNKVAKDIAFANLENIVTRIQDSGAMVVLGGLEIPFWGKDFNQAYKDLAEKTGAVLVPNVFEDIMGNSNLMSDRIHPNSAGYTIMAQHFFEAVTPYLDE